MNRHALATTTLCAFLIAGCGGGGGGGGTRTPAPPNPAITVAAPAVLRTTEGGGSESFTVVLAAAPAGDVSIGIVSSDPNEGAAAPATLLFTPADWDVAQTVTVSGIDDCLADGNVSYTIVIGVAVSADPAYDGMDAADVAAVNEDDDAAGIAVTPTSGLTTTEAGGTALFEVALTSCPTADVTVPLASANDGEGTVSPASLTFTPANALTPQTATVTGVDDCGADGDAPYAIIVGPAASADAAYDGADGDDVAVTNTNDDIAGIAVTPTLGLATTEAGGTASFEVVLTSCPAADVTVPLASSDEGEGTVSPASLTFTPANALTPQTAIVTGVDDCRADGDAPYTIIVGPAASADAAYEGANGADVAVTNEDDDAAGLVVTPTSPLVTTETGATATFLVALASCPSDEVTVSVTSSDTSEGTVSLSALTFTPGNALSPQTVTVTGADDALKDGSVVYQVSVAVSASADQDYAGLAPATLDFTNSDDDTPGITIAPTSGLVTSEPGGTATFIAVLESVPSSNVTIDCASSNPAEGAVSPASITFTPADALVPRTVTLRGVDDPLPVADGDQPYTIVISPAASADPEYAGMDPTDVSAINVDDDVPGISVFPVSGLSTTESGGTAAFFIALDTVPTAAVTIGLRSSDTAEGTVSPAEVAFLADATALDAQTITVTGVDDALQDRDVTYAIVTDPAVSDDATYAAIDPPDVEVVNRDDDSPGIAVFPSGGLVTSEAGLSDILAVVLRSIPSADVTLPVGSSNAAEGVVSVDSLTFTPADALIPQYVIVTGIDDADADGNIAYAIILGPTSSADPSYDGIDPPDVSAVNCDDEGAPPGSAGWEAYDANPTLALSTKSDWDGASVSEPMVVKEAEGSYVLWYQGRNKVGQKHNRIGRAVSADGVVWTRSPETPVLSHSGIGGTFDEVDAGAPAVIFDGATYMMWYGGRGRSRPAIGLATSGDGIVWTKWSGNPVLRGDAGRFDTNGATSPHIVRTAGGVYVMSYTGTDGVGVTRIGMATSTDGMAWVKSAANPVLAGSPGAWDAGGVKEACMVLDAGTYRMWYAGFSNNVWRIGYADSPDAVNWTKYAGNPVLAPSGLATFDSKGVSSPGVLLEGTTFRMWYTGEDGAGVLRVGYAAN